MNESRAAVRYAKAVLSLAVEKKAADAVATDMRSILQTLSENAELSQVLTNPVIKGAAKKDVLLAVFKGANGITQGLIDTMVGNKRIDLLKEVALKYILLDEKRKGEQEAEVVTAVPLTDALEQQVLDKVAALTGKKVSLKNTVDPNIIGGFLLRVGDLQYDASLANKLNAIEREFTNSL